MKRELLNNTSVVPMLAPTVTPLAAGTSNTLWIDRDNFLSAVISLNAGNALGSPTAQSVTLTIKTADDAIGTNATTLTDFRDGSDLTLSVTADGENAQLDFDLLDGKQYLGAEIVTAFTGGTSVTATAATGTLTFSGVVSDTETVTIGTDVYEFDTDSSVTPGNIAVDVSGGATAPEAVTALVAAITGATTEYTAADGAGDTVDVTYGTTGTTGNSVATTETCANGAWGAVTLTGGVDASPSIPINLTAVLGDPDYTRDI